MYFQDSVDIKTINVATIIVLAKEPDIVVILGLFAVYFPTTPLHLTQSVPVQW
jgi:hypothetical protein